MSSAATSNGRSPSRSRPSRSATNGLSRDSRSKSLTSSSSPSSLSTPQPGASSSSIKSSVSPRPLPNPRPVLPGLPSAAIPAVRKEKSKTLPTEPPTAFSSSLSSSSPGLSSASPALSISTQSPSSSPPNQPRTRTRAISSYSSVKGPRRRTNSQGARGSSPPPASSRVFITSTERSQTAGSGSLEKGSETTPSSSSSSRVPGTSSTTSKSKSAAPVPPARSPLRSSSTKSANTVKSADKRGDHVSSLPQAQRSRSLTVNTTPTPQHMVPPSNPKAHPAPSPRSVAPKNVDAGIGREQAAPEAEIGESDVEGGANGERVKLSVSPTDKSSTTTVLASQQKSGHQASKTTGSSRPRLDSASASSSVSTSSTTTHTNPSRSKTWDHTNEGSNTMVRSAISRSQSASATTTTIASPIGPRPPSSHKYPSPTTSSWCTPTKDRLVSRHASAQASSSSSSQRPSTATSASTSATSFKNFPTFSNGSRKASDKPNVRPSTSTTLPSPSYPTPPSTASATSPISTPSPRARERSGTVTQTPTSSAPSTHFLSPPSSTNSPQNSPAHYSMLSSSPLNNSMMFSSSGGSPLSMGRSHRLSSASEVSPVHLKRLLAKPAEASGSSASAYGSGSESEVMKGVTGSGGFQKRFGMPHGSDSEGGYKSAPGAIGGSRGGGTGRGEMKGRQRWLAEMQKAQMVEDEKKNVPRLPSLRLVQSLDTPPSSPPPPLGASASSAVDTQAPITIISMKTKGMSLPELEKANEKEKRIRNVLKRRPSTGGFAFLKRPGTPSSVKATPSTTPNAKLISSPIAQSPLPASPNMLHSPRMHSKSRSPSRRHTSPTRENSGNSSSGPPSASSLPPRSLTPAAQLAMAYREQEARREDLAGSVLGHYASPSRSGSRSGNTSASASVLSVVGGSSSHAKDERDTRGGGGRREEEEPGTPYYTVLGSTSGKVVAVGNPYDAWGYAVDMPWSRGREKSINAGCGGRRGRSLDGRGKDTKSAGSGSGKSGGGTLSGVGRTLSRKVSGRFRKGSEVTAEGEPKVEVEENSVSELGEMGGAREKGWSFGKSHKRRSLRLSIDKFAFTEDIPLPPKLPQKQSPPPAPPPFAGTELPASAADEAKRKAEPGILNGGRIWKLVKRISTGGLRDRYVEPPPPVPALPKAYASQPAITTVIPSSDPKPLDLARYTSRQSSQSATYSDAPLKKHATAVAKLSATGAVVSAPRPSLNTRSSSPVSDELASLRFSKGTHSSRSSSSSLFDDADAPPLPMPSMISQHIIPPSEFNRADTSEESVSNENQVTVIPFKTPYLPLKLPDQQHRQLPSPDDWFITTPYEETKPSLPLPPRDRKQHHPKPSHPESRSPSPVIPSFSTAAPINDFSRKPNLKLRSPSSPTTSQTQVATVSAEMDTSAPLLQTPPPPRPSRSRNRPSPDVSVSSSRVTSPVRSAERPITALRDAETPSNPPRKSFGGSRSIASTSRTERGRSTSPSSKRKTLLYRELNPVQKSPMLTDKEKNDKWNDLLERSARAGGTLHIGGGDLLSDRLSTLSMDTMMS